MKLIIVFCLGCAVGVGGMLYRDDSKVRAATNAHIDTVVGQAATAAHTALQTATK